MKRTYFPYVLAKTKLCLQIRWNLSSNKRDIFNYSLLHLLVSYIALNSKEEACSVLEPQRKLRVQAERCQTALSWHGWCTVPFWHHPASSFCFATSTMTTEHRCPACVAYGKRKDVLKSSLHGAYGVFLVSTSWSNARPGGLCQDTLKGRWNILCKRGFGHCHLFW